MAGSEFPVLCYFPFVWLRESKRKNLEQLVVMPKAIAFSSAKHLEIKHQKLQLNEPTKLKLNVV